MELISLHIPKTAGTSFKKVLESVYPGGSVLFDYGDLIGRPDSLFQCDFEAWQSQNRENIGRLSPELRVVHGHFWAGKYIPYFPMARKILWLRDPARLLLSAYSYWKCNQPETHLLYRQMRERNLSPLEFAQMPGLQNPVTRHYLKGYKLSNFDFVGIMEHFGEDLVELGSLLGWPSVAIPRMNKTENQEYHGLQSDNQLLEKIRSLNCEDQALYDEAIEIRVKRLSNACGNSPLWDNLGQ